MPERSSVHETFRAGVEATAGVAATAFKRFFSADIEVDAEVSTRGHIGVGQNAMRGRTVGFESSIGRIEGPINFNELVYLLAAHYGAPTFATNTATFLPPIEGPSTPKTLTVEKGSSVRAEQFSYGVMASIGLDFNLTEPRLDGELFGRALGEGDTLSSGVNLTDLACVPLSEAQWEASLGTLANLSDLALLTRVKSFNFNSGDKWVPGYFANIAQPSFTVEVERAADMSAELGVELDANGSALMAHVRTAAKRYVQLKALGPGGAAAYQILIQMPCNIVRRRSSDVDDLHVGTYTIEPTYDSAFATTGGYLRIQVTSDVTVL